MISPVVQPQEQIEGRGFRAVRLFHEAYEGLADPFLLVDHFEMWEATFPAHPHAGFSPLTYVFPDSQNRMRHADSLGNRLLIGPGALHWTLAGKGLQHKEDPETLGVAVHGLQIWMNLPAARKFEEPRIFHIANADIADQDGVRRIAGVGVERETPQPFGMADVYLDAGCSFRYPVRRDWQTLVYVPEAGDAVVAGRTLRKRESIAIGGVEEIALSSAEGAHVVLLSGAPCREPVAMDGPFVMNTQEELRDAVRRYRAGEFGKLI